MKDHCDQAIAILDDEDPDLVVLEPPCHRWSRLPEWLNGGSDDLIWEKRAEHLPLWRFVRRVWDHRQARGRLVITEQPRDARSLELSLMVTRPGLVSAVVAQCRFGLRDPETLRLYRKLTRLDSNDEVFAATLQDQADCICEDPHEVIMGDTFLHGKRVKKSAVAGRYTPAFAKHILKGARKTLIERQGWRVAATEADVWECYVALHEDQPTDCGVDTDDPQEFGDEDDDLAFQREVRKALQQLDADEKERRGDMKDLGARYAYIKFTGIGLQLPTRSSECAGEASRYALPSKQGAS